MRPKISEKKVNFNFFNIWPRPLGIWPRPNRLSRFSRHFYRKSLLIFQSLFLDFLGSFYFFHVSAVYPWFIGISEFLCTYRYAKRKKYEKIPYEIIFKSVLKLFRLKNLSFQKKIYVNCKADIDYAKAIEDWLFC